MGGQLPNGLNERDTNDFMDAFCKTWRSGKNDKIVGLSRYDRTFTAHRVHKTQGLRRDSLNRALRDMGVSAAEFLAWFAKR